METEQKSIRALKCEQSVLSRADGSVMFSQGNTVVMASVYGPLEAKIQKELSDRMYVEVNYKPKTGMPGVAERGKEKLVKTTCNHIILTNLHPRTAVCITIQEMQDGGTLLSASINAVCLALLDSGLPLQCLVAAVTCLVDKKDKIVLDPCIRTVKEGYKAMFTFAFDSQKYNLILSHCEGQVPYTLFQEAMELCQKASHIIFDFYRQAVLRKFSKELL